MHNIGKSSGGSTDGCFHGALVASWCPGDPLHQGVQFEGVVQKGPHLGGGVDVKGAPGNLLAPPLYASQFLLPIFFQVNIMQI